VKQRIAITDGEQRAALALTRSLGRAGHHVIVLSTRAHSLAGSSRFAAERCVVSDPLSAPAAYLEDVRSVLRSRSVDILLPVSEASLRAILPQSEALAPSLIPFAPDRTFRDASDKSLVLAAAARLGIPTPRQIVLRRRGEEERSIVQARLRFPLAVKPTRSVSERPSSGRRQGTLYVGSPADFDAVIGNLDDASFPLLVQERIIGPGIGVFVLLWNGTLHAAFAHRRIREKPPSGGVSVLSESMPLDPELLARSIALLREFDWAGVAMVEYKVDEKSGTPYLMEVNGRFWGSLQLAVDAGVDFPKILLAAAAGDCSPAVVDYVVGRRLRWEWGDVDRTLARLRHSPDALALPEGTPGRLAEVVGFLRSFARGTRGEVLRFDDPRPFVRETLDWVRAL
jgi:predicted ATP-grasp superfamily ATP-dependent carboligase